MPTTLRASLLMDPEVGLWVALGGGADHLSEATTRINLAAGGASGRGDADAAVTATAAAATESGAPSALRGFAPLLNTGPDGGGSSDRPTRRPRRRSQ